MQPQFLLVGLGNPGKSYQDTRHNLGFLALDEAAKTFGKGEWVEKQKFTSAVMEGEIDGVPCMLVKPLTFMNRSGEAIVKLLNFYKLSPSSQLLVFSDDIDLPLGEYRLRMSGGPGTHNGLKSIVERLGEGFPRLRIGLGTQPKDFDLSAWVLSRMTEAEKKTFKPVFDQIPTLVRMVLRELKSEK